MNCPSCGRPFDEGQAFCGQCGAKRPPAAATPDQQPHCPACGAPLEGGPFCPSCGAHRPPEASQPADGWVAAGKKVSSLALTVRTTCAHCAEPVPVNGPAQSVHCPHCDKDMPLHGLAKALAETKQGFTVVVGASIQTTHASDPNPECPRCGKAVSIAAFHDKSGPSTTLPCHHCGAPIPTYPAPAWLKGQLPAALQVFGGDVDAARAAGVDLRVDEHAPAPVAMACPSCGGGLTITSDTSRTAACTFCHASVFLPDDLWRRLHPVKTMLRWTLTYTGQLQTKAATEHHSTSKAARREAAREEAARRAADPEPAQDEAARREKLEEQREHEREARERLEAQLIAAKWKRRARVANYVVWALIVPAILGGWVVGAAMQEGPGSDTVEIVFRLVFCPTFAAFMGWFMMRSSPIGQIDKNSSAGDVIALHAFQLVGHLVVLGSLFYEGMLVAGVVGSPSSGTSAGATASASAAGSAATTGSMRHVHVTWPAKVIQAQGDSIRTGQACDVEADLYAEGAAPAAFLRIQCGGTLLFSNEAQDLTGHHFAKCAIHERPTDARATKFVYALSCSVDAMPAAGSDPGFPSLHLDTEAGHAEVARAGRSPMRVTLSVGPESAPWEGKPLAAGDESVDPGFKALTRTGTVRTVKGDAPVKPGARCTLRVEPYWTSGENCHVSVDCAGAALYGGKNMGFTRCATAGGAPTTASDPRGTPEDGDPTVSFDLPAGTLSVGDDIPGKTYSASIALDR